MRGTLDEIVSHHNPNYQRHIVLTPLGHVSPVIHNVQWKESFPLLDEFAHTHTIQLIAVAGQAPLNAVWTKNY